MQRNCKLILVEGLCGTGKSTLAERLHRYLVQQGITSSFYDEGAKEHPASLNWHAFFREDEYKELLQQYPGKADEIRSRAINDGTSYLIPYRDIMESGGWSALQAELESRELCWTDKPAATMAEFTYSIQRHWARFAELAGTSERIYIMEAVFFQHQIHDMLGHYQADDRQIGQHIHGIAAQIAAMHPVLLYLSQPSVREQQIWISAIRSKTHVASEKNIRFVENRKRMEMSILDTLPFPAYTIENVNLDWENVFSKMVELVDRNALLS